MNSPQGLKDALERALSRELRQAARGPLPQKKLIAQRGEQGDEPQDVVLWNGSKGLPEEHRSHLAVDQGPARDHEAKHHSSTGDASR